MKKSNMFQRIVSILICLCMVAAWLPAGVIPVWAEGSAAAQSDPHTLNNWKNFFGAQTGGEYVLSTEFAGGIWTDKSVFAGGTVIPQELTNAAYSNSNISFANTGDNFLIALSAIASNKQIKGYSTIPTDTVIVLDLSSSMRYTDDNGNSAIDNLAAATNSAISQLLELNKNNRIGVVLYAGNVNKSFSVAEGITKVLLPLDSYTPASNGKYVESTYNSSRQQDYALQVVTGVKNSAGQNMANGKMDVSTGTFIQDGIYEAMKLLYAADTTVDEGIQAGTSRIPIMVVMTDGEATQANNNYYGNYTSSTAASSLNLGNSTMHSFNSDTGSVTIPGGFSSASYRHRDTMAFMTSLTAAFSKKLIREHYKTEPLMYTLAYGEQVVELSEVRSVLNPAEASQVQKNLWTSFLTGQQVPVYRGNNTYQYVQNVASATDIRHLSAEDQLYVNKYFPAGSDAEMEKAFQSIVNEIVLQSKYYPTMVERDHNHDGYLTFTDKIGHHMDVVDVKGIVVGSRLFSGAALAQGFTPTGSIFGTVENPSDLGDNLIWSVKERLGIADASIARALVDSAYNYGQLHYNSDTDFSNYIGWFADANGAYVDFWHDGVTQAEVDAAVAKGAAYIVRSYMYLGDTHDLNGVSSTNMMYMSVRVTEEIATGENMVIWKVPASLIPTLTYEIEVQLDASGMPEKVLSLDMEQGTADSPIRLLYEVALEEDIYDWNLTEKVSDSYRDSTANKESGYVFYSNKWTAEATDTTLNTYSHFEPSEANERYYYTNDSTVYLFNGSGYVPYVGTAQPSGTGYFRQQTIYKKLANGSLTVTAAYESISANALADTKRSTNNQWYVPKNTMQRTYTSNHISKETNTTSTMGNSVNPQVAYLAQQQHYYSLNTLGNNGKLTMTPATGIKLTKTLTQTVAGAGNSFTFTVTGGNLANAKVVRLDAEGNEASRTALAASGEVSLTGGETVYIVDMVPGSYSITENAHADYSVSAVTVDSIPTGKQAPVTVTAQNINNVVFTNAPKGYGVLVIAKDVVYPAGFTPAQVHMDKTFTIEVTFSGDTAGMTVPAAAALKPGSTNTYIVTLKDTESATFAGIAEEVTYTVAETGLTAGYANSDIVFTDTGKTISRDDVDQARVVNTYTPTGTVPNVTVSGTKTVTNGWPSGAEFTVNLRYIPEISPVVSINRVWTPVTVTQSNPTYSFDFAGVELTTPGNYFFRVEESVPAVTGDMIYDRTVGLFSITVADTDADGAMEITAVNTSQNSCTVTPTATGWAVEKNFTNIHTSDILRLHVAKKVVDSQNPAVTYPNLSHDILFALYESTAAGAAYSGYVVTDINGKATFVLPVSATELGTEGKTYYLKELAPLMENRVVGMSYNTDWQYAIKITWNAVDHKADVSYIKTNPDGTPAGSVYTPYDEADPFVFEITNEYTNGIHTTPAIQLSGEKTLSNPYGSPLGQREFQFSVYETDATFQLNGNERLIERVKNVGSAITFSDITFTTDGMHYLLIKEENQTMAGVTCDTSTYRVVILAEKYTDNGITKLRIADGYPHITKFGQAGAVQPTDIDFANTYTITGSTSQTVSGTKILTGRPMVSSEFRFQLVQVDASGDPIANGTVLEAHNGAATGTPSTASFQFPMLTYTEIGEYYYEVSEIKGSKELGIEYSEAVYTVKVSVSDNGEGGLTSSKEIFLATQPAAAISFTNAYYPRAVQVPLIGSKELFDENSQTFLPIADGKFDFTITETMSDFVTLASPGVGTNTISNTGGILDFGTINFTRAGTRYFVIKEVQPTDGSGAPVTTKDGYTYDTTAYHVTVTAADDHKGNLEATITVHWVEENPNDPGNPTVHVVDYPAFTNRYKAEPVKLPLAAVKKYDGKTMKEFNFTLTLDGVQIQSKTNDADGNVVFDDVEFTKAGTYVLQLKEEKNLLWNFIRWDETMYTITVTVTDNGMGQLGIGGMTTKIEDEDASSLVFNNDYLLEGTAVQIDGIKTLVGGTLEAGMFQFDLYETADNTYSITGLNPVGTVSNGSDGKFQFNGVNTPALAYTAEGTHYYVLVESTAQADESILYDKTVYTFKVTVQDNEEGKLIADLQCTSGQSQVSFRNVVREEILEKDVFYASAPQISIDGETVAVGDILIYTIEYTNFTGKDANVVITDVLPGSTVYVGGSASHNGVLENGALVWEIPVAKDGSVEVSFKVKVTAAGTPIVNKASAVDEENQYYTNEVTTQTDDQDVPATSDEMNLALYFGLLTAATTGLFVLILQKKRYIG